MQARVKANSPITVVTAFGGHEYVRYEWRSVPDEAEEEAQRHPYLDVDSGGQRMIADHSLETKPLIQAGSNIPKAVKASAKKKASKP